MRGKNKEALHRAPRYNKDGVAHEYELSEASAEYVRLMNLSTFAMKAKVNITPVVAQDNHIELLRQNALNALEALRAAAAGRVAAIDSARTGYNHPEASQ